MCAWLLTTRDFCALTRTCFIVSICGICGPAGLLQESPFSLPMFARVRIVALVTRASPQKSRAVISGAHIAGWQAGWLCVAVLFSFACRAIAFDWTLIKYDGRDYVPVEDVAKFYSFTKADYANDTL